MTQMIEEKPSLDELVHFGVKGMKWGVRKKVSKGEIQDARLRIAQKNVELGMQRRAVKKASTSEAKASEKAKLSELKTAFLKNPDRATALRLTKGEAVAISILAGPTGIALVGAQSAARRRIERKQAKGKYDK